MKTARWSVGWVVTETGTPTLGQVWWGQSGTQEDGPGPARCAEGNVGHSRHGQEQNDTHAMMRDKKWKTINV